MRYLKAKMSFYDIFNGIRKGIVPQLEPNLKCAQIFS